MTPRKDHADNKHLYAAKHSKILFLVMHAIIYFAPQNKKDNNDAHIRVFCKVMSR